MVKEGNVEEVLTPLTWARSSALVGSRPFAGIGGGGIRPERLPSPPKNLLGGAEVEVIVAKEGVKVVIGGPLSASPGVVGSNSSA